MIRLLLVDDHDMVRTGLKAALEFEDDIEIVAEAASGEEAVARVKAQAVDVILMDLMMPGIGGIQGCREVLDASPTTRVLMLTSCSDDEAVVSSLMAGARGYLLKNVGRNDLARAIRLVADGKKLLDPQVTEKVTEHLIHLMSTSTPNARKEEDAGPLSEREIEVMRLVAQGYTNKQIAEALTIAEKTARNHISRILDKLDLTRRSQAAAWAIQHGLMEK